MTGLASRLRLLFSGRECAPVTYRLTRRVFLALLGVVYAIAFGSIWLQIDGLIGSHGIAPAGELLEQARAQVGADVWWRVPTVLLFGSSDLALHLLCGAGVALAVLVVLGIAPMASLALLWVGYLSIASVGDPFLGYQWDALLLETGLLAVFFAPRGIRPNWSAGRPSRAVLFLLRWQLFRLMFLSGAGKLVSGDSTWADLTALEYHYWTQPLPHVLSYWVARLPSWFHRASAFGMFVIEVGLPFLVFGPRRLRQLAGLGFFFLMGAIVATGNYGFFEPLTCVLCVTLFDDRALRGLLRKRGELVEEPSPDLRIAALAAVPVALVLLLTSIPALLRLGVIDSIPTLVRPLVRVTAPFSSFNSYGLFTIMTTERPEIVLEGSHDNRDWQPYEFRWKPGALDRAPRFAWAYMPRLDWQMWFAALQEAPRQREAWYFAFMQKLLEGEPAVLRLLAKNPFEDSPPRYIRATRWRYTFSSREERAQGLWWHRADPQPYCPTLELVDGRLTPVR